MAKKNVASDPLKTAAVAIGSTLGAIVSKVRSVAAPAKTAVKKAVKAKKKVAAKKVPVKVAAKKVAKKKTAKK